MNRAFPLAFSISALSVAAVRDFGTLARELQRDRTADARGRPVDECSAGLVWTSHAARKSDSAMLNPSRRHAPKIGALTGLRPVLRSIGVS
jgi:hypothetical protein